MGVSLQTVIEAPRRLDELSTARVISEIAEAVHKAQKGGLPLGTLMPQAIVLATSGVSLAPPAAPSIAYSAPEKLRGQAGDRRSDVFSLGVVLWEALAHERLFDGATDDARKAAVLEREVQPPSELNANVPAELDAICKKALSRDPANRYQSAKVMAAEISAVLDDAGYPDSNDEIAKYLGVAFPEGEPVAAASIGAAIAAKLASAGTPSDAKMSRQQLNATMHGFAPIREPAKVEPPKTEPVAAKVEPPKAEPVAAKVEPPKAEPVAAKVEPVAAKVEPIAAKVEPIAAKVEPAKAAPSATNVEPAHPFAAVPLDPKKTMPGGSGLSLPDLLRAETAKQAEAKAEDERAKAPSSNLSPTAFMKPAASAATPSIPDKPSAPDKPSVLDKPPEMPAPLPPSLSVTSTQPGTGLVPQPPADVMSTITGIGLKPQAPADVMATIVDPPKAKADIMATIVDSPNAKADAMQTLVTPPKQKAMIVDEKVKKPTLSNAETVATPALIPNAAPARSAGVAGLPAMPPGAERSFDDDFATNSGAKAFVEPGPSAAVTTIPLGSSPSQATEAAVDPSAAVSLPRSRAGTDKGKDVLADWGWSTDSHAAIDDGGQYEESPNAGRKRILIAAGSALGAILLIVIIAVAASGGGDKKKGEPKDEPVIADTSRTAPDPAAKPTDPQGAVPTTATDPVAVPPVEDPATLEAAKVEAAKVEAAKLEADKAAKAETAKLEAAKVETAKLAADNAEAAKAETARINAEKVAAAKTDAEKAELAKSQAANLKLAKAAEAKAETARINSEKADAAQLKADAAQAAKAEATLAKAEQAAAAKADAARLKTEKAEKAAETARIKAEKAEQARLAKAAANKITPPGTEVAKVEPKKEPKKTDPKKDPKIAKTAKPIDPYAEKPVEKPKADPAAAYKMGFQQYVRGDTSGALTTFKGSQSANPSYPPTYRGLGMVYEKLGQKAQAKKSFNRYLQLSPNASDAEQIRSRMERLGS